MFRHGAALRSLSDFSQVFMRIAPSLRQEELQIIYGHPLHGVLHRIPCRHRNVPVYVHEAKRKRAPALFTIHGGGFVLGDAAKNDALAQHICETLNITVVNINYAKAPENPYPAAVNDVYEVIRWFYLNSASEDIDATALAVMGFSCGANLAAVAAMLAKQRAEFSLRAQILHYPYLDLAADSENKQIYPSDIAVEVMEAFRELYCHEDEWAEPMVSPVFAPVETLRGSAPALIIAAEEDCLREEAIRYAGMLKAAGADVQCTVTPKVHHGYIEDWYNPHLYATQPEHRRMLHNKVFGEAAQSAVDASITFLTERFKINAF